MQKKVLISLTVISLWSGIAANQKAASTPMPTAEELKNVMLLSKQIKKAYPKVGICLRRIAIQMAAILDENAKYHNETVAETVQELSDRLRQVIKEYEEKKKVIVVVYFTNCGAEDVTDDFIKTIFPYPVAE
jgi:hypothetical protein